MDSIAPMLEMKDWLFEPYKASGFKTNKLIDHIQLGSTTHHTEYLFFHTSKRYALVNITDYIKEALNRSKVWDGLCFISTMHITAGIYINDAEIGLMNDIAQWIEGLAPYGKNYLHHNTGEDNGDAHLKSYLTNPSLTLPVTHGEIDLGQWQQIFYAEFDGKREKRILVKICGLAHSK